ncbi:hypothetical protein SLA2020_413400 [Shorea laevis]
MGEETPLQMHGDLQGQRSSEETIFVSVRLRPLNEKEIVRNGESDWECINKNTIVFKHSMPERSMLPAAYTFDRVFGCDCPTKEVYLEGAKEIALSVLNGINSTIFAYGQTSSGKTYTMSGITEFAMADIYDYVDRHQEREFVLKFSAMEIYNEHVRDLLSSDCTPLRLLDDPERGTVVERLIEETLRDKEHVEELLSICEAQRQIGETSLNETSSRSHQILRLTVESSARDYSGAQNSSTLTASVNFVDLAGSERASQTLSAGARLKEGCHINRSLLTLGTVIRKLSKGRNGQHIPYRDSKLTRILQNSLGANGRTAIICTMSPASSHVEQSRNTLLFASCAKEVTTNARVNLVMSDKALVKLLQRELARLEGEMKSLVSSSGPGDSTKLLKEKEILIEQMDKEIKELTQQRDLAQSRVENLLRSVEDIQTPKQDDYLAMATPNLANPRRSAAFNHLRTFDEPNTPSYNQHLELSLNPDDSFLLDDRTPKFIRLDPCQDWEEVAQKTHGESTDFCKEVRCVEIEKPCIKANAKAYDESLTDSEEKEEKLVKIRPMHDDAASLPQKVDMHSSPMNIGETNNENEAEIEVTNLKLKADFSSVVVGDNEGKLAITEKEEKSAITGAISEDSVPSAHEGDRPSQMNTDDTYDALRGRIQELQSTIKYLIKLQGVEQSPTSSDTSGASSRSISRSRSCRAVLNTATSSPLSTPPTGFERNFPGIPQGICQNLSELKYDSLNQNISKRTSLSCGSFDARTLKGLDLEDSTGLHEPNEREKLQLGDQIGHGPVRKRTLSLDFATMGKGMTLQSNKQSDENMEDSTSIHDFASGSNGRPQFHLERQLSDDSARKQTSTSLDFVPRISEMNHPLSRKQSSEDLVHKVADKTEESLENKKDTIEPASPSEFEIQQRKIIELWDVCYVPLIHRTYFFLLFKGDPSDTVYMEVELRRLSFLKNSLPSGTNARNDNRNATIMSSRKDLNRERATLSRQVPKKFSRREREELYKKWDIELNTKQRAQQLARRLWTDTKDMEHIKQSAALVAKLIGFVESSQAPKEVFGLSFLPRNFTRRSYSWK